MISSLFPSQVQSSAQGTGLYFQGKESKSDRTQRQIGQLEAFIKDRGKTPGGPREDRSRNGKRAQLIGQALAIFGIHSLEQLRTAPMATRKGIAEQLGLPEGDLQQGFGRNPHLAKRRDRRIEIEQTQQENRRRHRESLRG